MTTQLGLLPSDRTPDQKFADWKKLPGAGLVMQAYYAYAAWDYRRFVERGVPSSARFIEERVRDDIRLGKHQGIALEGYALNSHLTVPIRNHMIAEHPEWARLFEQRDSQKD